MIKNKSGIQYGLIAGVVTVLLLLLFYFIDPKTMLNVGVINGSILIYFIAMYRATYKTRESTTSELPLRDLIRPAFVTFLVANVIYHFFYYMLFNYLDPSLIEIQRTITADFYKWMLPTDQQKDALKALETADINVYWSTVIFGFVKGAIGGFVLAAITALLVQRL